MFLESTQYFCWVERGKRMKFIVRNVKKIIFMACFYLFFISSALASVVLTNTRVIYPGNSAEHTIQFMNTDDFPNIVQLWTDKGDAQSTPETADGPFIILPPIFKVNPQSGQSVRIIYTGEGLPQDKESVFYLNFLVIPPKMEQSQGENQLLIVLRNRIKIFYRPAGIKGSPAQSVKNMTASLEYNEHGEPNKITLKNDSGFYISLSNLNVDKGTKRFNFGPAMVAPYSNLTLDNILRKETIKVQESNKDDKAVLNFAYVNDYGAHVSATSSTEISTTGD